MTKSARLSEPPRRRVSQGSHRSRFGAVHRFGLFHDLRLCGHARGSGKRGEHAIPLRRADAPPARYRTLPRRPETVRLSPPTRPQLRRLDSPGSPPRDCRPPALRRLPCRRRPSRRTEGQGSNHARSSLSASVGVRAMRCRAPWGDGGPAQHASAAVSGATQLWYDAKHEADIRRARAVEFS